MTTLPTQTHSGTAPVGPSIAVAPDPARSVCLFRLYLLGASCLPLWRAGCMDEAT